MTKRKNKKGTTILEAQPKEFIITGGTIKDDYLNYSFDVPLQDDIYDTVKVVGKGIVKEDLINAFQKLNVHLACVDDAFKDNDADIDSLHSDEIAQLYRVTGFKIEGADERETIRLAGVKYLRSFGGHMSIETPKIPIDAASHYKWYNELKEASDKARLEVELYKGGKFTLPEKHVPDPNQMSIVDALIQSEKDQDEMELHKV